ncbi:MAG: glycosyl transferase, partial [Acidimicrobiales bacterium]
PEDVDALEAALYQLLEDDALRERCRANTTEIAARYRWSTVLAPIVEFCRNPVRAPDLLGVIDQLGASPRRSWKDRGGLRQDVRIVTHLFKEGGVGLAAKKAVGRARRLWTR